MNASRAAESGAKGAGATASGVKGRRGADEGAKRARAIDEGVETPPASEGSSPGVQSVRRALAVLRLVATGQEHGVRLTDIAAMSGLSRPTVHRLLRVLMEETAVEQDATTRRYLVGHELSLLGLARADRFPLRAIAEPYLQALADEVGDTVFLSMRHGADSVCIARHLGNHPIQVLSINLGVRRPLGASVSGIVLLASLEPGKAEQLTRANATRLALQQRSVADVLRLVRAARESGHAYAPHGVMPGTAAVAVPIDDGRGQVLGAISIAALADRLERKRLPAVLERMRQQVRLIGRRHAEVQAARARVRRRDERPQPPSPPKNRP
jgi:DNA-binding IclR family transcriptional regulator